MAGALRVLVVEDHQDIAANIVDYLEARGHRAAVANTGKGGMGLALAHEFDVIVLDVMLPGLDGYQFCRRLRDESARDTPVLMLTARDLLSDKIEGFRAGADDYVTKPFSLEELHARLQALARRARPGPAGPLRVGDLEFDPGTLRAARAGRPLELGATSRKILAALMRSSPNVVSKESLEALLWGDDLRAEDALRSQIYLLRQAVDRPFLRPMLVTVHGVGYRLVANEGP